MPELKTSFALQCFNRTKLNQVSIKNRPRPKITRGDSLKSYDQAEKISLSKGIDKLDKDLKTLLLGRRSRRNFSKKTLGITELSSLLWAAQGVTQKRPGVLLRTAPSAGALHPLETYCFIEKVQGLTEGIYHFCVHDFLLEKLSSGQFGSQLSKACLGQGFLAESAATICWSVVFRRTMSKYADRGLRYIFMDVGHVCQNVLLAAESMNLAACPIGAFWDDDLNNLLQLDGEEESAVYCVAIGSK